MTTILVSHRYETESARADQRVGVRLTSLSQAEPRDPREGPLDRPQAPLQLPALHSPTHYAPLRCVPEPQFGDPKRQEGSGVIALATPAVPPAADCGTAPPCGGRLYGGPARGLTFGLLPSSWITQGPWIDLWGMGRKQPTDSGLTFDIRGMQRNAPPVAFFTERTLATYLAVSDRTIRNWIRRGELPSYKLGASRRIDPADVDAFLAQRRDEPA